MAYIKDPDSILDYSFDWSEWLGADTISSYVITVSGVTLDSDSNTATAVTVWLSGGAAGTVATVECEITTAGGRTCERTMKIVIQNR